MLKFEAKGMCVKQSTGDADWLIVSTAMDTAEAENAPVVVVGTDTDLLVMLVAQATAEMDLHMLFGRNPLQCTLQVKFRQPSRTLRDTSCLHMQSQDVILSIDI